MEKTESTRELSEAEEMAIFKREFYARFRNSFYKKTRGRKDKRKELLAEYQEKRTQTKMKQQELLDGKIAKFCAIMQ